MSVTYRWKLEILASTSPFEEWLIVRDRRGRLCRYIDRSDAEEARDAILKVQPHATLRIRAM